MDRATAGRSVHLSRAHRRAPGPPPHRPAAVRGQRRGRRLAAAWRPDQGGVARSRAGGQLQPRRWLQGHLDTGPGGAACPPFTPAIPRGRADSRSPGLDSCRGQAERARRGPGAVTTGLLSRIAETLFWTGRYIERADDTARMVDVYVHRMLEEPRADEDAGCRAVLAVVGTAEDQASRIDIGVALDKVAYDVSSTSAIAGAVLAARTGARSVREVISSEMWECLNVTGLRLAAKHVTAERLGPAVYLRFVRERAALFFGLADSTMSHDDAWRFLVLGRSLERVDMTARMLLARMPATPYELGWPMLLRADAF